MKKFAFLTLAATALVAVAPAFANNEPLIQPALPVVDEDKFAQDFAASNNGGHLDETPTPIQGVDPVTGDNITIEKKSQTGESVDKNGVLTQGSEAAVVAWNAQGLVLYGEPGDKTVENGGLYTSEFVVTSKNGKEGTVVVKQPVAEKQADGTYEYVVKEWTAKVTFDAYGNAYIVPGSKVEAGSNKKASANNNGGEKKAHNTVKAAATKSGAKTLPKTSAAK